MIPPSIIGIAESVLATGLPWRFGRENRSPRSGWRAQRLHSDHGVIGCSGCGVPCAVVRQAAVAVADHEGLAEERVKDAVKGFLPGPDPDAQRFYSSDSLIVYVAFPLHGRDEAVRGGGAKIDADDIVLLYRQLGLTTVDEGLDLAKQAYPGRPVPARPCSSMPQ